MSDPIENKTLKDFQLSPNSIANKSDEGYGLVIARQIAGTIGGQATDNYYFSRNERFRKNRMLANGKIDYTYLRSQLGLKSGGGKKKKDYVQVSPHTIKIVNRIISGLVGRWMGRNEKIHAKATDPKSEKDRASQYDLLQYYMENRKQLEEIQQQSGVQMMPQGQYIPDDNEQLFLWKSRFNHIPEEILYSEAANDVLRDNGWFDVLKEMGLHDLAESGFIGTETWMDREGVIHVDPVKPENAIYSYSEYPDFRDTSWRGCVKSKKIMEIRKEYGKEFGGKLTEEQLFEIAAHSKNYQLQDKLTWTDQWFSSLVRPYDDWTVDVIVFELKSVDSEPYTITNTKAFNSTIVQRGLPKTSKGNTRTKPLDNQQVVQDTHVNIYRGVMVRGTDTMLEWGLKKNMIRPLDPKELGNAEFSFSFYMPQSYDMRNIAIPEKIEDPVEQMILVRKKIEMLIAKMKPVGAAINVDAMREIDLGLGGVTSPIELQRLYEHTGNLYYRGKDADGQPIPVPIQELGNAGFQPQLQALMQTYTFHYQVLKDELGEDPNLIQAAMKPRVAEGNVEASQKEAENATDYLYDGYLNVMEQTARKVCCLLHRSITFGADAYQKYIDPQAIGDRQFNAEMRMLPSDVEVQRFEAMMQQTVNSNPELLMFIDPMRLCRIAEEDVEMAELMFRSGQKKLIQYNQQQKQQDSQMNAQAQQQSLMMKAQQDQQLMQQELSMKDQAEEKRSAERQRELIIGGFMGILAKGLQIPPEWKVIETELINNIAIPIFKQNVENTQALGQALQGAQQQPQQDTGGGEQQPIQQPQTQIQ